MMYGSQYMALIERKGLSKTFLRLADASTSTKLEVRKK